ncbi:hypothetical protein [Desulfatitalea tepidiphila]|uniref:hypothetical protein n=1 Tax=Desulfatitalea tepidiphila TaxID=1185843 RepID=UPI0006B453AC|nr:hypothetical protein [Desulfatitalea tepidiphila]
MERLTGENDLAGVDPDGALKATRKRFGCLQVLGLMTLAALVAAGLTFFIIKFYFFPSEFKPVTLNPAEEKILAAKLEKLDSASGANVPHRLYDTGRAAPSARTDPGPPLEPERYDESKMKREIAFTEKELNGLLAKNTDLARRLAIDLSDDLVSAKLLVPVDPDFPIFGGKILRVRSGMGFSYSKGKPVIILRGISIMGVPIPNAWLGGLKNIDLVEKFGSGNGFWKTLADGIEDLRVEDGLLKIKFKE